MSNSANTKTDLEAWTIDDSEFDLKLNRRVLDRSGAFAQIRGFSTAQTALEALREVDTLPDVIFLDVMMPIKNGFDFLAEATEEFGDDFNSRVVIMLTSSLNPADRKKAESFAAVRGFLSKPLTVDDSHQIAARAADMLNDVHPVNTRAEAG
ncbi:MAG: response regulator [Pseudomonadota bacterium]